MSAKMDAKVPSFFTSPSLVNFGGLGVSDRNLIEDFEQLRNKENSPTPKIPVSLPIDIKPGWSGLGLHGNRHSAASLGSSTSVASGLFIEGDDHFSKEQVPGEQTNHTPSLPGKKSISISSKTSSQDDEKSYLKTTNMASFYYRKLPHSGNNLDQMQRSHSHGEQIEDIEDDESSSIFQRQKSKSHTDFENAKD
jgi:hypothetical protein